MPTLTLTGDDLRLRPFEPADAENVQQACNDPQIQRWLPLPAPYTHQDAETYIAACQCDPGLRDQPLTLAITEDRPARLLGSIGLHPVSPTHSVYEIGYWVAPWARGSRVAVRATRWLAAWALREHGVHRVELRIQPGNTASEAVARQCGFTHEGVLRSVAQHRDTRIDLGIYSLLPQDAAARRLSIPSAG